MKKCEFCGKQISYFDQYCDDECHIKANKFYEKGERFGTMFAVINMICVFGIPIGLFMLAFAREVGLTVEMCIRDRFYVSLVLLSLGVAGIAYFVISTVLNRKKRVTVGGRSNAFLLYTSSKSHPFSKLLKRMSSRAERSVLRDFQQSTNQISSMRLSLIHI